MLKAIKPLASLKLTLVGMVLLGIGSGLSYDNPMEVSIWVLVVPLALLAINLMAAIATNNRINQQPGLLVFHVCLLATVLLVGYGRLTHLDAHLEIPLGTEFSPELMMDVNAGPLHRDSEIQKVRFIQGPYTVQYAPGLQRGLTHSHVKFMSETGQWQDKVVGDDRPLVINKYRFYTTYNKGFTPILTWMPDDGEPVTGTINMPSYPLFEYKQDNEWKTPAGQTIKFWLQLQTGMILEEAWVLDGRKATGILVVTDNEQRREVQLGEVVRLEGGELRFEALSTWMGYRVFYDPTIQWLFYVTIFGVAGLSHYFWRKMNLQPWQSQTEEEINNNRDSQDADDSAPGDKEPSTTKVNGVENAADASQPDGEPVRKQA